MMTNLLRRWLTLLLAILAALVLSGCASEKQLPAEEQLVFDTDFGLEIVGTVYRPVDSDPPWPGVLLLHMIYGQR
jgi:dipeptidyl aminopeptidase/acylaminoacyl peptidase